MKQFADNVQIKEMKTQEEFVQSMKTLIKQSAKAKKSSKIELFLDIETFQYNEIAGSEKPTNYKNMTFSVAVSWYELGEQEPDWFACSNFKTFFDLISKAHGNKPRKTVFELIIHNGNKYDNHFVRKDTLHFYPETTIQNIFLKNATDNILAVEIEDLTPEEKEKGVILEKRVKSYNNLDMEFFIKNVHYKTTDNFMKTNISLKAIGKKLERIGVITKDELKTDFDYLKYNLPHDLEENEAYRIADQIFNKLDKRQLVYIRNDVLILAKCRRYYSEIFKGFDYSKMTFSQNVLAYYNQNPLTKFQLLLKSGEGRNVTHLKYTDYNFANENLYDYLKSFYRGGLNFYSDHLIGKVLNDVFGLDINSSYPYSMYYFEVPTIINDFKDYEKVTEIEINEKEHTFTLYRMTMSDFNKDVLSLIGSKNIRKMLVKYYTTNGFVNINSYTLKIINMFACEKLESIHVLSTITFDTVPFGSKEEIFENYKTKTQGKLKTIINMNTPQEYEITDIVNYLQLTPEEIANAKVLLNGLYGIPALRAFFNLFRQLPNGEYENEVNGYKNTERNIVFSIYVTAVSLMNLLTPLSYLTDEEIDKYFYYCDTDSLYLSEKVYDKIPKEIFDPIALGKWDIEHRHIGKFYVLNHKKYCYEETIEKTIRKKNRHIVKRFKKISVRCGGVPLDTFKFTENVGGRITKISFEEFINKQFSEGVRLHNTKSILNSQGTISIYPSETLLQEGGFYQELFSEARIRAKELIIEKIKEEQETNNLSDVMYIETPVGTLSQADIFPVKNDTKNTKSIKILKIMMKNIFEEIESGACD